MTADTDKIYVSGLKSVISTLDELPETNFDGTCSTAINYVGKVISEAEIVDNQCILSFSDNIKIAIYDGGQCCCEKRYMSTDDDLKTLIGYQLLDVFAKPAARIDNDSNDEVHESCFVEIVTTDGFVTLVNHNEHNGYYGGFELKIKELPDG